MAKAKLLSFFLGWWGIPWGIIYTLQILFESGEGKIPAELNADYLRSLGLYFLQTDWPYEAMRCWRGSLLLRKDPNLQAALERLEAMEVVDDASHLQGASLVAETPYSDTLSKPSPWSGLVAVLLLLAVVGGILLAMDVIFPTAIPAPTPIPASPTVAQRPPAGWTSYSSTDLSFSTYHPTGWLVETQPPSQDNPARAITFVPPSDKVGPESAIITVIGLSMPQSFGSKPLKVNDLKEEANAWLQERAVRVIQAPIEASIDSRTSVWMVFESDATDGSYTVRGYAAFVSAPKWLYYVEVAGLAGYDDRLRSLYNEFIMGFHASAQ